MMLHKKTRSSHLLKLLALVPIIGTALALNARTVTDYVYDEPQKKQIIKKGKANAKINTGTINEIVVLEQAPKAESTTEDNEPFTVRGKVFDDAGKPVIGATVLIDGNKTFDVVEQMPAFPGGHAALMQFLATNLRYPEEAHKNNIQGRVIVTFVVEQDGSIAEARIVKSVAPLLDAEALRVINSMPNWTPGRQNGEAVRVKYTVPVTFRLQGDSKEAANTPVANKDIDVEVDGQLVEKDKE